MTTTRGQLAVLAGLMVTMAGCAQSTGRDTGAPVVNPAW